jgi:hypothetical protein
MIIRIKFNFKFGIPNGALVTLLWCLFAEIAVRVPDDFSSPRMSTWCVWQENGSYIVTYLPNCTQVLASRDLSVPMVQGNLHSFPKEKKKKTWRQTQKLRTCVAGPNSRSPAALGRAAACSLQPSTLQIPCMELVHLQGDLQRCTASLQHLQIVLLLAL